MPNRTRAGDKNLYDKNPEDYTELQYLSFTNYRDFGILKSCLFIVYVSFVIEFALLYFYLQ